MHCTKCGRKGTKSGTRKVNEQTKICSDCVSENEEGETAFDPDCKLGALSFREFSAWLKTEFSSLIDKKVEEATKDILSELGDVKKTANENKKEVGVLKTKVDKLAEELKDVKAENEKLRSTGSNNLKYLVNLDRNTRRSNLILLGVPEQEDLTINQTSYKDDEDKIDALLTHIGVKNEVEVNSFTRLGKKSDNDESELKRPLKIVMKKCEMVSSVLINAKKLRGLDKMIFFKPDKSKKERDEFQRLLKKKNESELSHPTGDGQPKRVVLEKGVLTVDGVVIDRYKTPQSIF